MAEQSREKAKRDFRQEATDLIVDMLEKGTAPWQRPWDKNTAAQQLQMPHNGATAEAMPFTSWQRACSRVTKTRAG